MSECTSPTAGRIEQSRHLEASCGVCVQAFPATGHGLLAPAHAALNLPVCLSMTAQMYGCLEHAEWRTCVVCWRAWYDLPGDHDFEKIALGRKETPAPWFKVADSTIVGEKRRGAANQWRLGVLLHLRMHGAISLLTIQSRRSIASPSDLWMTVKSVR